MSSDVPKGHMVPETCGHTYVTYVPTTVKKFFTILRSGRNHSRQISVEESALNNRGSLGFILLASLPHPGARFY